MKKGCFVKLIIIITIFTAIIVYVIQNKFDELVLNPGKQFFHNFTREQIDMEFEHVKESPEKDSLVAIVRNFFNDPDKRDNATFEQMERTADSLKQAASDSIITPGELRNLQKIFRNK